MSKYLLIFMLLIFIISCTDYYKVIDRYKTSESDSIFCMVVLENIKTKSIEVYYECDLFLLTENYKFVRYKVLTSPMWRGIE